MDKVKVSRAATSLVARGLMRQAKDPDDGRGRLLRLTRKRATVYSDVSSTGNEIESELMAGLTKANGPRCTGLGQAVGPCPVNPGQRPRQG